MNYFLILWLNVVLFLGIYVTMGSGLPEQSNEPVLVDINSMLDVGFMLIDPEGREVSHFTDVNGWSGHYTVD